MRSAALKSFDTEKNTAETRRSSPVLVYGPSGSGKTTAFNYAKQKLPQMAFASLDELAKVAGRAQGDVSNSDGAPQLAHALGASGFLELGIQQAERFCAQSHPLPAVLDVGAGFLDAPEAGEWLAQHETIVFLAPPIVAFERILAEREDERSLEKYVAQEFSVPRKRLYELATVKLDANGSTDEVGAHLVSLLSSQG